MRLIIVGTGGMAHAHANHFQAIKGVKIVGAVDVSRERVTAFAKEFGIPKTFLSLDDALIWGKFEAAANVTPDQHHHATTMALIAAGKHVLCEKPLATNHAHALEMTDAIERAGLVGMVNLSYRNVAALHKMRHLIAAGDIGTVRHVEASYLQSWLSASHWGDWRQEDKWLWRLSTAHGSKGVMGDIGIHILDFVSFGADSDISRLFCRLKTFPKAEGDRIGDYVLDANDSFSATAEFSNGALGVVHASRWASGYANTLTLRAFGDKGGLELVHGFDDTTLRICKGKNLESQTWKPVKVKPVPTIYERFAKAVKAGRSDDPTFRRAADIQRLIDLSFVTEADRTEHSA